MTKPEQDADQDGNSFLWTVGLHADSRSEAEVRRGNWKMAGTNGLLYVKALQAAQVFLGVFPKPTLTTALIVANTLVHFRPGPLDRILPHTEDVCLNPHLIWEGAKGVCKRIAICFRLGLARRRAGRDSRLSLQELFSYLVFDGLLPDIRGGPRVGKVKDLRRLVLSAFYHADHAHLLYNMTSLVWNVADVEQAYGSKKFASMLAVLLGLSHGLVVLSSKLIDTIAGIPGPLYRCSVGFSAVLFAMKVVLTQVVFAHYHSFFVLGLGIVVPNLFAVWAELAIVHIVFPDSSLLAHLCGILAGFIYVLWPRGSIQPLSWIFSPITFLFRPFFAPRIMRPPIRPWAPDEFQSIGIPVLSPDLWRCRICNATNTVFQDACAQCHNGRDGSEATVPAPPSGRALSLEELENLARPR